MTREAQIREVLDIVASYRIGLPVTIHDCEEIMRDMRQNMPADTKLDVCIRGLPERARDGSGTRIEIIADGQRATLHASVA